MSRSANKRTHREIPSLATSDDFLPGETFENTLAEFNYPGREPRLPKDEEGKLWGKERAIKAKFIDVQRDYIIGNEEDEGISAYASAVQKMTPDQAHDYALVTAARIREDIKWKGQAWEDFTM